MRAFWLGIALVLSTNAYAQRERELPAPAGAEYGAKFFDQLQKIFGQFRNADLRRVFQTAQPVQCSDLVTDKGEWREVAFFNENRRLGDWYRTSLEEIKDDLSVYVFKGACGGRRAAAQVTTKFPLDDSIKDYQAGRIRSSQIEVNVNAPVAVTFDSQIQAYSFDLPYLFRVTDRNGDRIYTLNPPRASARYATDVKNHWDCKRVAAEDVTYQFLICHTTLISRNEVDARNVPFGASAYTILSDGKEASSNVTLTFEATADSRTDTLPAPAPATPAVPRPAEKRTWQAVASATKLIDVGQNEFRLHFNPDAWQAKIDQPQVLADGRFANPPSAPKNKSYCAWRVSLRSGVAQLIASSGDGAVLHSLEFKKQTQSGISAIFELQNEAGAVLGVLDCLFVQSQTPADITVVQWQSIVGPNIELETPAQ